MANNSSTYHTIMRIFTYLIFNVILLHTLSSTKAFVIPNASFTATSSSSSLCPMPSSTLSSSSPLSFRNGHVLFSSLSSDESPSTPEPKTFREAEILGLRLMQEGQHEEALKVFQKGMKLPGSRTDIIRTRTQSGPSPVGGSAGGTEGRVVKNLDEFELQAAHYNIACAYARLGKVSEACTSIENAFQSGFDNYETVRGDPDLSPVHDTLEFDSLMEKYDSKKGFNPFAFFNK
mmetsp:Transcript_8394/g.9223  ORF Transcript_8394/g.9223 Transcript_8394/m.9223 type:complete len:233 (+) Transcript_8394:272-970(+)